jgi:hypothetical protein
MFLTSVMLKLTLMNKTHSIHAETDDFYPQHIPAMLKLMIMTTSLSSHVKTGDFDQNTFDIF